MTVATSDADCSHLPRPGRLLHGCSSQIDRLLLSGPGAPRARRQLAARRPRDLSPQPTGSRAPTTSLLRWYLWSQGASCRVARDGARRPRHRRIRIAAHPSNGAAGFPHDATTRVVTPRADLPEDDIDERTGFPRHNARPLAAWTSRPGRLTTISSRRAVARGARISAPLRAASCARARSASIRHAALRIERALRRGGVGVTYDTPQALRAALEARLRNESKATGLSPRPPAPAGDLPAHCRSASARGAWPLGRQGRDGTRGPAARRGAADERPRPRPPRGRRSTSASCGSGSSTRSAATTMATVSSSPSAHQARLREDDGGDATWRVCGRGRPRRSDFRRDQAGRLAA